MSFSMQGWGVQVNPLSSALFAAVIRVVHLTLESPRHGIPEAVIDSTKRQRAYSCDGACRKRKTTTLASIVNLINKKRNCRIVTLRTGRVPAHHKTSIVNSGR